MAEQGPHGWLVIDKPPGMTSNHVVGFVRSRLAVKVGHAGTLDPLASGVLPLALGEATKTASFAMSGRKHYRFRVRWGVARDTLDSDGAIVAETPHRPEPAEIEAALPRFVGRIAQTPPAYSAIKIGGRRAYALARSGAPPALAARSVDVASLSLIATEGRDYARFEAIVGKGVYIRALAQDLALALGTLAHVVELRRLSVGRFAEAQAISLEFVDRHRHSLAACGHLLPIETALDDIPALALTAAEAARLRQGQRVRLSDPDNLPRLDPGTVVSARCDNAVVALARIEGGDLRPMRIIRQ
ncbi:MAG TPA: tRNA pseudouridine(55) synthase TruB [Stellaceae bacterium]|nr:tRNA pseudouridine(55) synthase TruB [Stellaceae bacterium]